MFKIQIPKPCHEDWKAMTPTQQGAFCNSCNKEVVDFTKMTDAEVQHYFLNNTSVKTCGHFRAEQVDRIRIILPENILLQKIAGWKKFMAVIMLTFGSMLFGCDIDTKQQAVGEIISPNTTTTKQVDTPVQLLGDTTFIDTSILSTVPAPNCTLLGMVPSYVKDSSTKKHTPQIQPTVEGEIELTTIGDVDKPDTADYDKMFTGKFFLERKDDTATKKPAPDTSKCKDTGYY